MLSPELQHVGTRSYYLDCNWKVFVDNYLVSKPAPWRDLIWMMSKIHSCCVNTRFMS